ncbi:cell division protein FtsQ/DivIB [Aquimarina rhabdastrellae]
MKIKLSHIRNLGLIVGLISIFAFTSKRNATRRVEKLTIEFLEEQNPYITESAVNKLLIQNRNSIGKVAKEALVLNALEKRLDAHKLIKDSDVYLTVNGELKVNIRQRTPIARVNALPSFYVDDVGKTIPLSGNFTAHVPLVYNVKEKDVPEVYPLLKKIYDDEFMRKHIIQISKNNRGDYELKMRIYSFDIYFGKIEYIETKVNNLKAFYQKARKDKSIAEYAVVNLQYRNQVVCTKK